MTRDQELALIDNAIAEGKLRRITWNDVEAHNAQLDTKYREAWRFRFNSWRARTGGRTDYREARYREMGLA